MKLRIINITSKLICKVIKNLINVKPRMLWVLRGELF